LIIKEKLKFDLIRVFCKQRSNYNLLKGYRALAKLFFICFGGLIRDSNFLSEKIINDKGGTDNKPILVNSVSLPKRKCRDSPLLRASTPIAQLRQANHRRGLKTVLRQTHLGSVSWLMWEWER
jgi:hypothetical protein